MFHFFSCYGYAALSGDQSELCVQYSDRVVHYGDSCAQSATILSHTLHCECVCVCVPMLMYV